MTRYYRDAGGRYLGGFHGETGRVPEGAVEVSGPPDRADYVWVEGTGWQPDASALAAHKVEAKAIVDDLAGIERRKYITVVPGQPEVYEQKQSEVRAWEASLAGGAAPLELTDVPWMVRRAARLHGIAVADVTRTQVAAIHAEWSAKIEGWQAIGLDIEDVRERAKEEIDAATTPGAIDAVLSGLDWPAPA